MPQRPFDVLRDQLIPERARMMAYFGSLRRMPGSVVVIEGRRVTLSGGQSVDAALLLSRCACLFRSLDAGNLYLPQTGLDGIGAAPWANALMARSIMSHILGTAQLDMVARDHKVNHFDIVTHLAPRDSGSFEPGAWHEQFRRLALQTPDEQPYPVP